MPAAMVSVRRLKRISLVGIVFVCGLVLYYSTPNRARHTPTVQGSRERKFKQETTEGRTESSGEDSVELTQQPARPGDKWEDGQHGLDDNEEIQDTLRWLHWVGTRPPDITTTSSVDLHQTEETLSNEHVSVTVKAPMHSTEHPKSHSSQAFPTSRPRDTAVSPTEDDEQTPIETTSEQHVSNEEQPTQEEILSPIETTSEQHVSNEEQPTQEEILSPIETTSEQHVSTEEQPTQEETLSPRETTSEQHVSNETSEQHVSNEERPTQEETLRETTSEQHVSNETSEQHVSNETSEQHVSNEEQPTQEETLSPRETTSEQHVSNETSEQHVSNETSEQHVSNEEQPTQEETRSPRETTSEQHVSNEEQPTQEETLSPRETTSEQHVSNEEQPTQEETLSPRETTSEQHVSNEERPTQEETRSPTATRDSSVLIQEKQESDNSATEAHHTDRSVTAMSTTITTPSSGTPTQLDQGPTTVYTPALRENACTLPKLDPWDPSIKHLLQDVGEDPGCNQRYPPPMFDVVSNKLVTKANVSTVDFNQVKVETIHRSQNSDTDFYYVNRGNPFNVSAGKTHISNIINSSDHFRLEYKVKDDKEKHVHFFSRVAPQQVVVQTAQKKRQQLNQPLDLNVLMIGFDSLSRANFLRKMPNSLAFLRKKLSTFFFEGYSIVGDATTPALTALLTGKYVNELPEGRRGWDNGKPIDDWPWIMRKFEESGYVTLHSEDDESMSAFNLRLLGFKKPPAHHYARPFWLAVERAGARDGPGVCSKSTSMVNYTLEYLTSFYEAYPDTLKFAFSFMSYISHAHPNHLSYADKDLLHFLATFVRRRHHENTILIVFGDHGSRNGNVRDTMQGKLEERLPWLSISMPKWLRNKNPDVLRALAHNQHVIATPFDVHATLHHVLTFPAAPTHEKTQSLFTKLDTSRTCRDAGIDEHWCPCLQFKPADTESAEVNRIAKAVVAFINERILSKEELLRESCAELHLETITAAFKYEPNKKLRSFTSTNQDTDRRVNFGSNTPDNPHFQVTVQTRPGNGLFEASVTTEDERVIVNPHISRINKYGDQPKCVSHAYPYARKYCFCELTRH